MQILNCTSRAIENTLTPDEVTRKELTDLLRFDEIIEDRAAKLAAVVGRFKSAREAAFDVPAGLAEDLTDALAFHGVKARLYLTPGLQAGQKVLE